MDSGEYESTKRTGTFDRRLFDNKVFKLELKPLAADASLDQVNKFIEEFGEAVAELDRYMYAAFTNLLKGSHSTIAKDTGGRSSYVMAATRLYSELNKNELPTA